jgi:hypothetical protein
MINDPQAQEREWRERLWRRTPDPSGEKILREWLAAHPEVRVDLEAEAALTKALGRLPDAAMPSNFTARVLQQARAAESTGRRAEVGLTRRWGNFRWAFGLASAGLLLCVGVFSYQRIEAVQRANMRDSVLLVSKVTSRPSTEVLEDLDTIERLTPVVAADEELIALLK